ncbi:hypothetical protein HRI_002928300 [Hibiscus trionum]|uniref:Uncharacterized protein n=1 Tax=Hibiscus trionum TaxID=183268 RepID=A0A9W7IDR0_HIBTR|nr:hypothetical protein HRI_002928300 [Hibiscus trionum]
MMMLGRGKEELRSPETELSGGISGKLNVFLTESDDGSELSYEGLVEEEKVEEIMQELYKEITLTTSSSNTSPPTTVTFPSLSSSSSLLSSLKISESCGASVSDSSSTVMAGIEFVGPTKKLPDANGGSPSSEKELWIMETEKMEVDDDIDQWLGRVLGSIGTRGMDLN